MADKDDSGGINVPSAGYPIADGEFHVFLSHNSADKPSIRILKSALEKRGIKCWLDEDELRPGMPWQKLLEVGIRKSKSVVVAITDSGLGPWEEEEMNAALMLAVREKLPVIPTLLPMTSSKPTLPMFLSNRRWVDLSEGFNDERISELIWGITGFKGLDTNQPESGGGVDRKRVPRRRLILTFAATGGIAFAAFSTQMWREKPIKISIGIKQWVGYTPFVVAKQMGLFPSDIEVDFIDVNSATEISQRVANDEIQIGFLTIADLVDYAKNFTFMSNDENRPMAIFMIDTSRGADGIVARSPLKTPADLVGQKYIIQTNDVSEFMLKRYCKASNLDYDDFTAKDLVLVEKPEAAAKMFHDDTMIAAAGTYEPHLSRILDPEDSAYYVPGASVILDSAHPSVTGKVVDIAICKQKFLTEHQNAVRSLTIGWYRAVDFLNNATGVKPSEYQAALEIACKFNAEPEPGDDWHEADWLNYQPISLKKYAINIKGLCGTSAQPWPTAVENKIFFKINGSTSDASSHFQDAFDEWKEFLDVKGALSASDFDGSRIGLDGN